MVLWLYVYDNYDCPKYKSPKFHAVLELLESREAHVACCTGHLNAKVQDNCGFEHRESRSLLLDGRILVTSKTCAYKSQRGSLHIIPMLGRQEQGDQDQPLLHGILSQPLIPIEINLQYPQDSHNRHHGAWQTWYNYFKDKMAHKTSG